MKTVNRTVALQCVGFTLNVLTIFFIAKQLGSAGQGEYAWLRAMAYLIEAFLWFGLNNSITYFVALDRKEHGEYILKTCGYYLIFLMITSLFTLTVYNIFSEIDAIRIAKIILWIFTLGLVQILLKFLLGSQLFLSFNIIYIVSTLLLFINVAILTYLDNLSISSVVFCHITSNIISFGLGIFIHRSIFSLWNIKLNFKITIIYSYLHVGFRSYISTLGYLALYRVDFYVVGYYLGLEILGLYSVAIYMIEAMQKIPEWLGMILTPKASNRDVNIRPTIIKYSIFVGIYVLTVFLFLLILNNFVQDWTSFIGLSEYSGVEEILPLLFPRVLFYSVMVIYAAFLAGKGYPLYHLFSGISAVIILSLLSFYLAPISGLNGIIGAGSIAFFVSLTIIVLGFWNWTLPSQK